MMDKENGGSRNYLHPFTPYQIQIDLMDAIYDVLENYKIGIFESPTGTGKTLSLICSSMTWLRNYKKRHVQKGNESESENDSDPEWVTDTYERTQLSQVRNRIQDYEKLLDSLERNYGSSSVQEIPDENRRKYRKQEKEEGQEDKEYILDDYESDQERDPTLKGVGLSEEINQLLSRVEGKDDNARDIGCDCPVKIFFSSRTHSQLSQFAQQLGLTRFDSQFKNLSERIKFTPLGSRKQLCIHPEISKKLNVASINDACVDLQQNKNKHCEFIPRMHDSTSSDVVKKFSDLSFTRIHDIEDLGKLGEKLKICPYYSVRNGLDSAEIVGLPYQMLFQSATRSLLGLNIDNSVILIDEAHNLYDTISSLHSVSISNSEISMMIKSLSFYLNKFIKRLNIGNRVNIMKLIKLCHVLEDFFLKTSRNPKVKPGDKISLEDLFRDTAADLINIFKVEKFLNKSKVAYKVESYMNKIDNDAIPRSSSNPLLFKITQFIKCLTNPSKEGKLFWDKSGDSFLLTYMLLDSSAAIKEIVDRARCVILIGGTMEPMSEYTRMLFPSISSNMIKTFSCGHIIPDQNLLVCSIGEYQKVKMHLLFSYRNDQIVVLALGELILRLLREIPDGAVIFFPSYGYLHQVTQMWRTKGLLERIEKIKQIFLESNDSKEVESLLSTYSFNINSNNKASVLFSVVGGKMSEGINFSDRLARAVIMVGLPYPNIYSGELKAKRTYLEETSINGGETKKEALEKSNAYYENICVRAINQSIGRSIRHKDDYAAIYLIDQRYGSQKIQCKLSNWIKKRVRSKGLCDNFEEVLPETKAFFAQKMK